MSIETFSPLALNTFGTWVTLLDPSDVPPGMSPNLGDIDFFPGGVRTRPGLVSQYPVIGGTPKINGLKTYITANLVQRLLVLDSIGNLYKETSPGVLSSIAAGGVGPNLYLASATHFGREYMAFGDGLIGRDMPRQFDDSYLDRVSQIGPAEGPLVADAVPVGNISPGTHQCVVVFVTRQGYWTAPSPPVSWTASGGHQVAVTNIPTGPSNVVKRLVAFTASGGASFYHVPATMVINDNTTTSLTIDFTDTILLSGVSMDYLFSQIELPEQLNVVDYTERLFWWGERAQMDNWRNLTFDGGWDASGNGRPLGWQLDPAFGAGGSREQVDVVWGDAYRLTADGVWAPGLRLYSDRESPSLSFWLRPLMQKMLPFADPYWWTVGLASLVQLVLFLRWLYRRIRNDEITRIFVQDMATNHLPHIYFLLEKLCDEQGIARIQVPPLRWIDLNNRES